MPITAEELGRFPLLRALGEAELNELAPSVQARDYSAGELIFREGTPGDNLYLLESGRVEIFRTMPDGEVLLNDLPAGQAFGELSLLDGRPRSGSARAVGDVTVLEIPKPVFLDLTRRFPALVYQTALENAQRLRRKDSEFIRELQERNRELRELYSTSLDISRHLELEAALSAIVERAAQLLNSAAGALHLYDAAARMLLARAGGEPVRPGEGATGQAFNSGEAVIQNASAAPTRRPPRPARRSELAAPVRLDAQTLGALTVYRPSSEPPYTADDARLLLLLGNQVAIAIENARLYGLAREKGRLDGELRVAREVQRRLIPTRAPRLRGFQLSALWRPAHEVAGDFYDFIRLPGGRWGIVIADVSDKGMPAALFMATTRSILRASALAALSPDGALARANRLLAADATGGMFVTAFCAILDPRARRFRYANAGHNPPLWLRRHARRLERLSDHTLALGIAPELRPVAHTLELREGDVLVLYTDGLTEAVNGRDELYGEARLMRLVRQCGECDAHAVVRALDRGVQEFVGARPLADDITLVALAAR